MDKFAMKKILLATLLLIACLALTADYFMRKSDAGAGDTAEQPDLGIGDLIAFQVESNGGKSSETIRCVQNSDDVFCVYLPSYSDMGSVRVVAPPNSAFSLDGIRLRDGLSCDAFAVNTELALSGDGYPDAKLAFLPSANVATLFIDTRSGSMDAVNADKSRKEAAVITLYDKFGIRDYQSASRDQIRGRGQWSWTKKKRPYNLYLDADASLLNMSEAKKWALIANMLDEGSLRNWLVYTYARKLGRYSEFAPECAFTDVYLNGCYNGLYLLCEKIDVYPGRLNPNEVKYLFDFDLAERIDTMKNPFLLSDGVAVEIIEPSLCYNNQIAEVQERLQSFEAALLSDNGVNPQTGMAWSDYIDLDSFARKYLIEEIFENYDAGAASQFFYWSKTDDKIYAGPCWDYDNILGISTQRTPNCFLAQREWKNSYTHTPWFAELWRHKAFRNRVIELYTSEFLPELRRMLETEIPEKAREIEAALKSNSDRWKAYYDANRYYDGSLDYMTRFLEERIDFLTSAWVEGVEYKTITFILKKKSDYQYYCLPTRASCADIPSPQDFGLSEDMIWFTEDDMPFDSQTLLTEDVVLYAKKPSSESVAKS